MTKNPLDRLEAPPIFVRRPAQDRPGGSESAVASKFAGVPEGTRLGRGAFAWLQDAAGRKSIRFLWSNLEIPTAQSLSKPPWVEKKSSRGQSLHWLFLVQMGCFMMFYVPIVGPKPFFHPRALFKAPLRAFFGTPYRLLPARLIGGWAPEILLSNGTWDTPQQRSWEPSSRYFQRFIGDSVHRPYI